MPGPWGGRTELSRLAAFQFSPAVQAEPIVIVLVQMKWGREKHPKQQIINKIISA